MAEIVKNVSGADIFVADLGICFCANSSFVVPTLDYGLFASSQSFVELIDSGDIVINDGENDLSSSDAKEFIVGDKARGIRYCNASSGLSARTVQAAIDELKALIDALSP